MIIKMLNIILTWIIIACVSIIVLVLYFECLRSRWQRRKKDIDTFCKKMDEGYTLDDFIEHKGSPITQKRKPFISV